MARVAAKDIKDTESLERWLSGRPVEDARVIAARAALRTLPALDPSGPLVSKQIHSHAQQQLGWKLLLSFRALATAWVAAQRPIIPESDAASAAAFAADAAARSVWAGTAPPTPSIIWKMRFSDPFATSVRAIDSAIAAIGLLARWDAADELYSSHAEYDAWDEGKSNALRSISHDGAVLDAGTAAAELSHLPLWWGGAPAWVADRWKSLKSELHARPAEHWDEWIDWYEARLRGEPGNEEEEIARILEVTEEEWAAGPAVANKKIKDIVARFRSAPKALPKTASAATPNLAPKASTKAPAFISHAAQADGARASALTRDLEAAGLPCWIAPRDIPSGADWNAAIMRAIDACDAMILLVSDAALKSPFVKAEVQHAFEKGKRVFPIRLADSVEAGQIDLRLKIVQHIDGRGEVQAIVASVLKSLR